MVQNTLSIDTITVQFFVNCKTFFGQNVYICGNCEELGNWNPHCGIKLETNRKKYPEWSFPHPLIVKYLLQLFRSNVLVQFKICIVKDKMVTWQGVQQNHYFIAGIKSIQIFSNFNSRYIEILEKKVFQIECRKGTHKIIQDFQSQWGSSIDHSSNYPIKKLYNSKKLDQNRSQISSNLISITDSQQIEFQQKIFNYFNSGSLFKTTQKPSQPRRRLSARKQTVLNKQVNRNPQSAERLKQILSRRSYCSLPKDYNSFTNKNNQNSLLRTKSYPRVTEGLDNQECVKQIYKTGHRQQSWRRLLSSQNVSMQRYDEQQKRQLQQQMCDQFSLQFI